MEAPRVLKSFLIVISLLALFMIINILTSVNYLYKVVDVSRVQASDVEAVRTVTSAPGTSAVNTKTRKPEAVTPKPKSDSRPDSCNGCFVHNFKYLIQNETICHTSNNENVTLIMLIFSIHAHVRERNNIRATWTAISEKNSRSVRYAFLLGRTKNNDLMKAVYNESEKYGDILMEDFVDLYSNLTYKTLMGMKWASLFCPQAKYVMKTDDDMWVNVPELLKLLDKRGSELQTQLGGACNTRAGPIRDHRSKWFASVKSYPHNSYPGFCSGTGYVTSMNVVQKVYEISPNVPFFHLEDVYVALCIRKLGMTLVRLPGFHNWRTSLKPCEMRSSKIITSHMVPTDFLPSIMNAKC